jgi:hypothetical protein
MVNLHCSETKQSNIRTQAKLLRVLQGSKTETRSNNSAALQTEEDTRVKELEGGDGQ